MTPSANPPYCLKQRIRTNRRLLCGAAARCGRRGPRPHEHSRHERAAGAAAPSLDIGDIEIYSRNRSLGWNDRAMARIMCAAFRISSPSRPPQIDIRGPRQTQRFARFLMNDFDGSASGAAIEPEIP
jgi:hypothetical protein